MAVHRDGRGWDIENRHPRTIAGGEGQGPQPGAAIANITDGARARGQDELAPLVREKELIR